MYPAYHVFDLSCSQEVPAEILPAIESDFRLTVQDCWQTSLDVQVSSGAISPEIRIENCSHRRACRTRRLSKYAGGILGIKCASQQPNFIEKSQISRHWGCAFGLRSPVIDRLWLRRYDLSEGKNLRDTGTLYS